MFTLTLDESRTAKKIDFSHSGDDVYKVHFYQGKEKIGMIKSFRKNKAGTKLVRQKLEIPAKISTVGFNKLEITPHVGDGEYYIGHFILE